MADRVTNYKCPACTGPLHFHGGDGRLRCDYCGSAYEVAEIERLYADKESEAAAAGASGAADEAAAEQYGWSGEEAENMRAYSCPSCGAQLICDASTAATSCPYCNNPTVVPGQFAGVLRPRYVIPFRLDGKAARDALRKHCKGKPLLPKSFASENHIDEIKGVYVPFWMFSGKSDADIRYRATRVHSHTAGNTRVTVTEHYDVARAGTLAFEKVPVDASTKMPDAHMDAVEPYDYSELKPFSTAYLPGYLADRYDVEAAECAERARARVRTTTKRTVDATAAGYTSLSTVHESIEIDTGEAQYALMPVWVLNTVWKGGSFLFAMNGQTGKMVGNLPISWGRFWAWFAGISVPLMAIACTAVLLLQ